MVLGIYTINRWYREYVDTPEVDTEEIIRNLRGENYSAWVEWDADNGDMLITNASPLVISWSSAVRLSPLDIKLIDTL